MVRLLRLAGALSVLLLSTVSFSEQPKSSILTAFPKLPSDVLSRISGKIPRLESQSRVDSKLNQDWGLNFIGYFQSFTPLAQPMKGGTESCSSEIVVAVIDTGIDYTHPELKQNLWINPGESGPWEGPLTSSCHDKSCNGVDDDGDGLVDDVVGWDFVNDVPLPYDTHGHGTHISGIISGVAGNGLGSVGVCPKVSIMPLKYYDSSGIGYNNLNNTVRAIYYAVAHGAHIINYSGGGADPAESERMAIEKAQQKGILFIAAAGNDGHNNDITKYFPASYGLDNIVSVASVTRETKLLPSSNFGKTVNLAAPGLSILSSLPNGKFGTMSGTSQATAYVTGAAALLASQFKDKSEFSYRKVRRWLLDGAKPMKGNEAHKILSAGVLSVPGSLRAAKVDQVAPAIATTGSKGKRIQ